MKMYEFNLEDSKFDLDFLAADSGSKKMLSGNTFYKIIVADDDKDVHTLTDMLFQDFDFENSPLQLIHTFSGKETIRAINAHEDTAVLLLDVVMEEMNSGIKVVEHIRQVQKNKFTRIVLRTGQPGYAPEESLIRDYDINDYKLKTEMTRQKLYTMMYSCLRSYRDLIQIETTKKSLEEMVKISGELFQKNSFDEFLDSLFQHIRLFQRNNLEEADVLSGKLLSNNGFIVTSCPDECKIISASGKYRAYKNTSLEENIELEDIFSKIINSKHSNKNIVFTEKGLIFFNKGVQNSRSYVYIEAQKENFDESLIQLLINNYVFALENYQLGDLLIKSQKDIIFTLSETIERHSNETSNHVKRVSLLMKFLASRYGLDKKECETLAISSVLHDIGKIGIPDSILKKPARLSAEEFEIIKNHTTIGYDILRQNNHPHFEKAAQIAYCHHEKYDGSGYPRGLSKTNIPLYARMMAIIDVFDALVSKRCYKESYPINEVVDIMRNESGKHFDPILLNMFLEGIDEVKDIIYTHND